MSLYDDEEKGEVGAGWSSGIRLLQSQLKAKKAATINSQPIRRDVRKPVQVLPPVIDLKSKRDDDETALPVLPVFPVRSQKPIGHFTKPILTPQPLVSSTKDYDWDVIGEYDPMWPNDYDKTVKEMREQRDRENDLKFDEKDRKSHRKRKSRFGDSDEYPEKLMQHRHPDEDIERSPPIVRTGGAAIAPPPSLQEPETLSPPPQVQIPSFEKPDKPILPVGGYGGNSVAAKIMAKYGFKEGQGLGKKEQGMSMALQVEKTSKRGGRIIHEKDGNAMPPPPPPGELSAPDSPLLSSDANGAPTSAKPEPSITEIMKSPSKVVLLRNMVGSGDVDEELEPEVKDECNTKYGEVIKVVIFEIPDAVPEEAVRIFVEFKRIESAIKAVVDLNGRFFGGRQVKAGFYSVEQFLNLKLLD